MGFKWNNDHTQLALDFVQAARGRQNLNTVETEPLVADKT